MMVTRASGTAAEERIRRIPQARTSSISVNPATLLRRAPRDAIRCDMKSVSLLHSDCGLAGDHLNGPLLGVFGVHLHDGQLGTARSHALDDDAHQRTRAADTGRIRHSRRRDNGLSAILVDAV